MVSEVGWNPASNPNIRPFTGEYVPSIQTTVFDYFGSTDCAHSNLDNTLPNTRCPNMTNQSLMLMLSGLTRPFSPLGNTIPRLLPIRRLQKPCQRQINTNSRSLHRRKKTIRASRSSQRDPLVRMEHSWRCNCLQDPRRWCCQALDLATKA